MKLNLRQAARWVNKLNVVYEKYLHDEELTIKDAELMVRVWRKCDAINDIIVTAEELAHEDLDKLDKDADYLLKATDKWHELREYSRHSYSSSRKEFDTQILCDEKMRPYKAKLYLKATECELWFRARDMYNSPEIQNLKMPLEKQLELLDQEFDCAQKGIEAYKRFKLYQLSLEEKKEKIDSRWYCNLSMFCMLVSQLGILAVCIQEDIDNILYEREGNHEES